MKTNSKRVRADKALVELGLVESRTRAQALIMAGKIYIGEQRILKAGNLVDKNDDFIVRRSDNSWVSRGGTKLEHALYYFDINPAGCTCIDVGASTGGFTDVLLKKGATKVFSIDVGKGQLDWRLRQDQRVVVLEETNARHLTENQVPELADLVVCDTSFIGLDKVLPRPLARTKPNAKLIALIKPQFQAKRKEIRKGGIVRDSEVHTRVCHEVKAWLTSTGWSVLGITKSPITGKKGNSEFLIAAVRNT